MSILMSTLGGIFRPVVKFMSKKRIPKLGGEYSFAELSAPVKVTFSKDGIPTIEAKTLKDAILVQGYVHAQERLWEMELNRRTARGLLADAFGPDALPTDVMSRTFGFEQVAELDWQQVMTDEEKELIEMYVTGINYFISEGTLPIEFSLSKIVPREWEYKDVIAFGRLMLWQLSHAWHGVLTRWKLRDVLGEERMQELTLDTEKQIPPILKIANEMNQIVDGTLQKMTGIFLKQGAGSNSITVSGALTNSGKPINSNDVHLPITTPSLWYQMKLVTDEATVRGISLPGMPLILIGATNYFSWGITLAYLDGADLFIEKVNYEEGTYEFKGETKELTVRQEEIPVKDGDSHTFKVYSTHHGPIVSPLFEGMTTALSNCDRSLQPSSYFQGWLRLNRGESWDDFVEAMRHITGTQLNISYADVEGNIGYWATGEIPVRNHDSLYPVPGWTGEHEWEEFIPFEEMPHALNPEKGYIVTCNHKVVDDTYPHYLGKIYMNGYRAQRIEQLLDEIIESGKKITRDDINRIMYDEFCIPADIMVSKYINSFTPEDKDEEFYRNTLLGWSRRMSVNSVGATLYETLRYYMVLELFEKHLDSELLFNLLGIGPNPILLYANELFGHDTNMLFRILNNPESQWIKDVGGVDELIRRAMKRSLKYLRKNLGRNPKKWTYGRMHRIYFPHAFDVMPPLNYIFNPSAKEIGGNTDTPKQTAMFANQPFDNRAWSISYRYAIDYGEPHKYYGIIAPGQSGHLGSPHYSDLVDRWLDGEYLLFP